MSEQQEEKRAVRTQGNTESIPPPPPAERSRLTQCFPTGSDNLRKGNFDYAVELFGSCVAGDPASAIYLQGFLEAVAKKFSGKKSMIAYSFDSHDCSTAYMTVVLLEE